MAIPAINELFIPPPALLNLFKCFLLCFRDIFPYKKDQYYCVNHKNPECNGHAIEFRINAEDPSRNFLPSPGVLTRWIPPKRDWIRFDSHVYQGYAIPPYYDSLLGKLIVFGSNRDEVLERSREALRAFEVQGVAELIALQIDPQVSPGAWEGLEVEGAEPSVGHDRAFTLPWEGGL